MGSMVKSSRFVWAIIFSVSALVLMGMSGLGGDTAPQRIPIPEKNFQAIVVDLADVNVKLTMFSINGYTFFMGRKGKGQFSVPFDSVNRAEFRQAGEDVEAHLYLKDGKTVILAVDRMQDCFGKTQYGNFRIKLGDVKTLTIEGQTVVQSGTK